MKSKQKQVKIPKSISKIMAYFRHVVNSDDFQKDILDSRKRFAIPEDGLEIEIPNFDYSWAHIGQEQMHALSMVPDGLAESLWESARGICKKYGFHHEMMWGLIVENYIIFNKLPKIDSLHTHSVFDMCEIEDTLRIEREIDDPKYPREFSDKNQQFPISLRISAYASKRDILKFIEREYREVEKIQVGYMLPAIKLGEIRPKRNHDRDEYIYEMSRKKMPYKKIASLVFDNFSEIVDEGNIGKIISIEKKRRK